MKRILEPEVMDTEEEARDYDAMDHHAVNQRFCSDLTVHIHDPNANLRICDLGAGTARIAIALCSALPHCHVVATDLSHEMLRIAEHNIGRAGLKARIEARFADAKSQTDTEPFDVVCSNSLVHHIPTPKAFFAQAVNQLAPGGLLFIRDLLRPSSAAVANELAHTYAPIDHSSEGARVSSMRQRDLLLASLHAALTVAEVQAYVGAHGIPASAVTQTSDRHWTLAWHKS